MVSEKSEKDLDTAFTQRLDNFLIVSEDIRNLRVCVDVNLTFLSVIVDIGSEKNHIVHKIATILHLPLKSIQRVGIIHLEEEESLFLARFSIRIALTCKVFHEINAVRFFLGNRNSVSLDLCLERKKISLVFLELIGSKSRNDEIK